MYTKCKSKQKKIKGIKEYHPLNNNKNKKQTAWN